MATKTPRIKHNVRVKLVNQNGAVVQDNTESSTYVLNYGAYLRVPVPKKIGEIAAYSVIVEYLGEHQYKQTYAQRVKALAASEKRREAWQKQREREELERNEKELIQRRKRIMNQIELAFVKKGKDAVNFVTCDKCSAMATRLCLAYENPGSQVIDPEQITGAVCEEHGKHPYSGGAVQTKYIAPFMLPYKTKATIACNLLEFFYDGLRQIYVKATVSEAA